MRIRWFCLIALLIAAAFVLRSVARADLNYRAEITGVEDNQLADLLEMVSELKMLRTSPRFPRKRCAAARTAISAGSRMPHTAWATGVRNSPTTSTRQPSRRRLR